MIYNHGIFLESPNVSKILEKVFRSDSGKKIESSLEEDSMDSVPARTGPTL